MQAALSQERCPVPRGLDTSWEAGGRWGGEGVWRVCTSPGPTTISQWDLRQVPGEFPWWKHDEIGKGDVE